MKKTAILSLGACLLFAGCSVKDNQVSQTIAAAAIDAAGLNEDSIKNLSVNRKLTGYEVNFQGEWGAYSITVAKNGSIESFELNPSKETEKTETEKPADQDQQETPAPTEDDQAAEEPAELPEGSLSKEKLAAKAAQKAGITDYQVDEFTVSSTDNDEEVIFSIDVNGAGTYDIVLNPFTGKVISSSTR